MAEADAEVVIAEDCDTDVYVPTGFMPLLEDRVVMVLTFYRNSEALADLKFVGSYTDINGKLQEFEVKGSNIVDEDEERVTVAVDIVAAKDLRQMVTGALYSGDTQVSDSVSFSFECYAVKAAASEENICAAILNYCDAAKELFKKPAVTE